jgi:predicted ATP-grasp superfamily ATP-dependent carboligase
VSASPTTAIVTDALWRKSVASIRSLGRSGYDVTALGDSWLTTGFYSRFTRNRRVGPTAARSEQGFGELIGDAVAAAVGGGRPVILPMEDESCSWLLRNGTGLEADWLLPSPDAFAIANDKAATTRLALSLGVPCPRTLFPSSPVELLELARSEKKTRWIAKPYISKGSVGILYDNQLAAESVSYEWQTHGALMLQERIDPHGQASGVSLLYDKEGQCRAVFCHRRLKQYPLSGGPSTSRVSVPIAEMHDLVAHSRRILENLGWRGVAMVEWKQDQESGEHRLLEINPRFWGSLELAIRSGVDFPTLYARAAAGSLPPGDWPAYQAGVICRWMVPGEILRYLGEARSDRESLRAFLKGSVSTAEEFSADDLMGSLSCVLCPALLALNPRYWGYVRRGEVKSMGKSG